jgi:hypothetical protein
MADGDVVGAHRNIIDWLNWFDTLPDIDHIDRHYRPPGLRFELDVDGATPEDIERGINAAKRVFLLADLSPYAAGCAVFYVEAEDEDSPVSKDHLDWYSKWSEANNAAVSTACANMPPGAKVTYLFGQTWDGASETNLAKCIRGRHTVGTSIF